MYNKTMTIKRRLFLSNIRMVFISFLTFAIAGFIVRVLFFGPGRPDNNAMRNFFDPSNKDMRMFISFLSFALFIVLISIINNLLTHRMTKRIVKPLEPLNEGVKQIQANNFAYRIDYNGNDEFTPVCDAFNDMAVKLETSTEQQKKDEANRRELIAGMSHDLRTPLTSIQVSAAGIKSNVAANAEQRDEYLDIIINKSAEMERLINQLFMFSKLDIDEFSLEIQNVNCGSMIEDCIDELSGEYEMRGLGFTSLNLPHGMYAKLDPLMFRQVIINIFENAVRYKTKEKGQMTIDCVKVQSGENDNIEIILADDGPGVPPEILDKLFDVFYRADKARSKKGSGLGLSISAKLISKMGGKIHAELPKTGGLAIVISFPLVQKAAAIE